MADETTPEPTPPVEPEVVSIPVVAEERPVLAFTLGDDPKVLYARRPKQDAQVRWQTATETYQVVRDIFIDSPESYDHVIARLQDHKDSLDIEHLSPILDLLEIGVTGRPTGRPSSSGRSSTTPKSGQRSKGKRR